MNASSPTSAPANAAPHSDEQKRAAINAAVVFSGLTTPPPAHRGKVRDVYAGGDELLIVTSDRVSAFDVVLGTVPLKGQLLTEQAVFWLERAAALCNTHLIERPNARSMRVHRAQPLLVEVVVRGYLTGSLLREPAATRGRAYGLTLDPQQLAYRAFDEPILTPTTKAPVGEHDLPISEGDLVTSGRVSARVWQEVRETALALFAAGQAHAKKCDLILVDTKYEFGLVGGAVTLIDEVHTADSSRYWERADYAERLTAGGAPQMLDKERLRQHLIAEGYQGIGPAPELDAAVCADLALHYWNLTERLTGKALRPRSGEDATLSAQIAAFQRGASRGET